MGNVHILRTNFRSPLLCGVALPKLSFVCASCHLELFFNGLAYPLLCAPHFFKEPRKDSLWNKHPSPSPDSQLWPKVFLIGQVVL